MNEPVSGMCFSHHAAHHDHAASLSESLGFTRYSFVFFFFILFFWWCHFHNDVASLSSLMFWMLMTYPVINPVWSCKYSVGSCHPEVLFRHILTRRCCLVLTFRRMGCRLPTPCPWRTRPRRCRATWGRTPRRRSKRGLKRPRHVTPPAWLSPALIEQSFIRNSDQIAAINHGGALARVARRRHAKKKKEKIFRKAPYCWAGGKCCWFGTRQPGALSEPLTYF